MKMSRGSAGAEAGRAHGLRDRQTRTAGTLLTAWLPLTRNSGGLVRQRGRGSQPADSDA